MRCSSVDSHSLIFDAGKCGLKFENTTQRFTGHQLRHLNIHLNCDQVIRSGRQYVILSQESLSLVIILDFPCVIGDRMIIG